MAEHDPPKATPPAQESLTKAELRQWAKGVRSKLPIAELSSQVNRHLANFLQARGVEHILLYHAFGSELDPAGLMEFYPASYYLPRVDGEMLHIHALSEELIQHQYGMSEPSPTSPTIAVEILQAVLIPGLVFDKEGYRIGYGKGYYDRFLAQLSPETLTIGLVPETLVAEALPKDPWDIPVQYLATETGLRPSTFDPELAPRPSTFDSFDSAQDKP